MVEYDMTECDKEEKLQVRGIMDTKSSNIAPAQVGGGAA